MQYLTLLEWMFPVSEYPTVNYSFSTKQQTEISRKAGGIANEVTIEVPDYASWDAIIWTDEIIPQPTSAECDIAFAAMQQSIADKEAERVQRQDDIDTGRASHVDRISDPESVTLLALVDRVAWLENEIRKLVGL